MWQHLLRQWLTQQAKEQVWQAARAAAEQPAAGQPSEPLGQRPCDVLVACAQANELAGLEDRLAGALRVQSQAGPTLQAGLDGCHLVGTVVGREPARARELTALSLEAHRPAWLVSAGFATALSAELRPGDIVMAERVVDHEGRSRSCPSEARAAIDAAGASARWATVLSLPDGPPPAADRPTLAAARGALAADGLGWELSRLAEQAGLPWLAVRVVLEGHDEERPGDLDRLAQAGSNARWLGGLAGLATGGGGRIGAWWRWQERVLTASDRLGAFLAGVIPRLRR